MAGASFTSWYSGEPQPANPSAIVGSMPPQVFVRSVLDARRMMQKQTPEASYPDGYLGTIVSRRGDRLLDSLKARENQRSYQRGVHKGERIDPGDYLWPSGVSFDPLAGVQRQARTGKRYAPALEYFQPTPSVDGYYAPRGSESILTVDSHRASQLSMLAPRIGFPPRRQAPYQG